MEQAAQGNDCPISLGSVKKTRGYGLGMEMVAGVGLVVGLDGL